MLCSRWLFSNRCSLSRSAAYSVYRQLSALGKVASVVKIGSIILNTERTDAQILELYKELGKLLLQKVSSKALGLATFAIAILDYSINQLFETNMAQKKKISMKSICISTTIIRGDRSTARPTLPSPRGT